MLLQGGAAVTCNVCLRCDGLRAEIGVSAGMGIGWHRYLRYLPISTNIYHLYPFVFRSRVSSCCSQNDEVHGLWSLQLCSRPLAEYRDH